MQVMPQKSELGKKERSEYLDVIDSAFDLTSVGMAVQLHIVDLLGQGKVLPYWAEEDVNASSSNYFATPYVIGWIRDGDDSFKKPKSSCPNSNLHKALMTKMYDEYDFMKKAYRIVPSSEDETRSWDEIVQRRIEQSKTKYRGLRKRYKRYLDELVKKGFIDNPDYSEIERIIYNDKYSALMRELKEKKIKDFKKRNLQKTVYKLGCMLAITDQLTYDAAQQGMPIPANYKSKRWGQNWRWMFGEPMPTIEELYTQAFRVFTTYADPKDPYVTHLFTLEKLPFAH